MKKNRSIYHLLGLALLLVKKPGPNDSPDMKHELGSAVHFHTSLWMSIKHVALRGLVNPDKAVKLIGVEDNDGDPQKSILISAHHVLLKHKAHHLPL